MQFTLATGEEEPPQSGCQLRSGHRFFRVPSRGPGVPDGLEMLEMRMRRVWFIVRLISFATAMAVALPVIGACQAPDSWIGKRVITKFGTVFEPKPGDPTDAHGDSIGSRHRVPGEREKLWVYRVEQATGQWLQLVAENEEESGWVTADRVVTLDQSIENLNDEIRANPTAENFNNRGLLWTAMGSYDRAITDISEAIRLKPKYGPAYNNRGLAWFHKGNYDAAIRDFGRAIKVEPTFTSAYSNRGVAWSKKREPEKAIADYTEAIRINPKFARAYCSRGIARFGSGDPDKAFADFNEAIRLEPKFARAYSSRATAWSAKGEYEKATRRLLGGHSHRTEERRDVSAARRLVVRQAGR